MIVLTVGCMTKQIHIPMPGKELFVNKGGVHLDIVTDRTVFHKETGIPFSFNLLLILIQVKIKNIIIS